MLSLRPCRKMNNVTIASGHPGHPDLDWVFAFHQYEHDCPQIDTQTQWNLCIRASIMNAKQDSMPFPNFWTSELRLGAAFLTDNWLEFAAQKKILKQISVCTKLIRYDIKVTENGFQKLFLELNLLSSSLELSSLMNLKI